MTIERDLEIMQGNQVRLQFTLSVRGVGPWNVAGATSITLTLENDAGVLTPVEADDADPSADWVTGKVPVLLPASATQSVGPIKYALTVAIGDESVTPVRGVLNIEHTPGFVPDP